MGELIPAEAELPGNKARGTGCVVPLRSGSIAADGYQLQDEALVQAYREGGGPTELGSSCLRGAFDPSAFTEDKQSSCAAGRIEG